MDLQNLMKNSLFIGQAQHGLTVQFFALLKQNSDNYVQKDSNAQTITMDLMKVSDKFDTKPNEAAKKADVLGFLTIDFRLMIGNLREQMELSNQQIRQNYYDPFESDPGVIDRKL